ELAAMMPRAGGQYVFLREAYGSATGFLFGWTLFFVVQTGTIAAVAIAFAIFMGVLTPTISDNIYIIHPIHLGSYAITLSTQQLVAIFLIVFLTFTNTRGLKTGKLIQNTFTFTGSEIKEPGRNLPRALLIGCGVVVLLYLLANVAYVVTLPLSAFPGLRTPPNTIATETTKVALGQPGVIAIAIAIMISTFGCNNGLILAGARIYYAMARDGVFFKKAGNLSARHVPVAALIAQGIWTCLLTLPRTVTTDPKTGQFIYGNVYGQLLDYVVS